MKKEITETYKDNYGRKYTVTFMQGSVRIKTEGKNVEEIITKKSFELRRKFWEQIA